MAGEDKIDQAAGKAKEAAGKVTGDKDLQNEGETQHGVAKAKDAVKDAANKIGDAVKNATHRDK
ncbi:CsbD family protein [Saccharomonospora sp. NPDC006951]